MNIVRVNNGISVLLAKSCRWAELPHLGPYRGVLKREFCQLLCFVDIGSRIEGISQGIYYKWSKDFMEAGKKRLAGDITRQANTSEVKGLRSEARELKECVAELTLENRLLKKSMIGDGDDEE